MEGDGMFPGERFCPMEDELLLFYLKPKVNGMQVPGDGDVICEMDLYGDQDPWKIWKDFEEKRANDLRKNKDLYFFTQKKKKTARSSRVSRTVGSGGTWKGQNAGKEVFLLDENEEETTTLLGFKKTYTYKNKNSVHDGGWILHEYELHKSQVKKQVNKNDYVLCLLKKKDQEKKREREQEEENLEVYVEEGDGDNSDHGFVGEGSQEKRQRVLPPVEADQEQFLQPPFEDQVLQLPPSFEAEQEAVPTPSEDQPVIFLDDEINMELQESDFAILENWCKNVFGASTPATLEDGQNSVLVDENSGLQQEVAEQQGEENLEQKLDPPSVLADEMMSGVQFHPDENLAEQTGAEANVYVENLGDSMDEDWLSSFVKEQMNDEQKQVMEVEELITTSLGGYSDFDLFEY